MTQLLKYIAFQKKPSSMLNVAYKMLIHSRKKLIGMVIGATFSAFIIMQQPAIYKGICERLVADIIATQEPDLWVMGVNSQDFRSPTYFTAMDTYRVRSIPGVLSATHLYRFGYNMLHLKNNDQHVWQLIGVDPDTLAGLPKTLISGSVDRIRDSKSIIIDGYALKQLITKDNTTIGLNDTLVEGTKQFVVSGITKPQRTWDLAPKAYILSNHIHDVVHRPSFMLVNINKTSKIHEIAQEIHLKTGYDALTRDEFISRALKHFQKTTPIITIFICIAIMGFIIGLIIMWQIFSSFILTHLHQFGMLKMLGVSNSTLKKMVLFQASCTGGTGYLIGLCLTVLFGLIFHDTDIAFKLTWQIVLLGAVGATVIVILASYFSIRNVLQTDTIDLCRDQN